MSSLATEQEDDDLVIAFESWRGKSPVLSPSDLQAFVRAFKAKAEPDWPCTVDSVVAMLERHGALSAVTLPSEGDYRPFHRYVTPTATTFDVAATLRTKGYFSHATAVFAHGLTEQIPQTIYLNDEQSQKPSPAGALTQAALDRAFRSRQRVSKFAFIYDRSRIVILNGKQTGSLGVAPMELGRNTHPVTDLERTMIDIAVRPVYGGGIYEILAAYQAALDRIDVGRIVRYLDSLGYMYPYHQAIGFYLERSGASAAVTTPLRDLGLDFDFHLVHGLKKSVLDPSWRVHIPEGL